MPGDAASQTPVPAGSDPSPVTMTAWAAAATAVRNRPVLDDSPAPDAANAQGNPTLIEGSDDTRGFDSLLYVSDLPRDAFEDGFDRVVEDALHTNFDLEKLLDGDSDDESDGTPDVLGDANLPGIHELSDLGED